MKRIQVFDQVFIHNDVIKWKCFSRNWPYVTGIRWIPLAKTSLHNSRRDPTKSRGISNVKVITSNTPALSPECHPMLWSHRVSCRTLPKARGHTSGSLEATSTACYDVMVGLCFDDRPWKSRITLYKRYGRVWASYQIHKIAGCACAGNAGNVFPTHRLQRKSLVSDPGMHHGTCVTHVPWCMSVSLTCGGGENVPGIPGACASAILRNWQEAHGT